MHLTRQQAIKQLIRFELAALPTDVRAAQLDTMLSEDWSDAIGWELIPGEVREEIESGALRQPADFERYDSLLLLWLGHRLVGVSNDYLVDRLCSVGVAVDEVTGPVEQLHACPCCGRASLDERGGYDICQVCWWEDDGQDNREADSISGPNHLSLTQARVNFLLHGICDPQRTDLRAHQQPASKYRSARQFELSADQTKLREVDSDWSSRAFVM